MRNIIYRWMVLVWVLFHSTLSFAYSEEDIEIVLHDIVYLLNLDKKEAAVYMSFYDPNSYVYRYIDIPDKIYMNPYRDGFIVTKIYNNAFKDCEDLRSIHIPNTVKYIGENAFFNCSNLISVNIPNSVTSIRGGTFWGCWRLTSIDIPNSVTSISGGAFASCSGLTSINVENGNTIYDSRGNCNAIIETSTNTLIAGCKNTTIPNSVKSIGSGAFSGRYSLTSITIPNSVTSIGSSAFYYCGLTSITIPNSVKSIGNCAFEDCNKLTSITIPNSVTSIGDYAFSSCI